MAPQTDHMTDEEIARLVQNGDREAFGVLMERYEAKLLRYGRRFLYRSEDVEDLVQVAFLKAYINIQGFHANRKFSPWLYRIAHNEFVNTIKKKVREALSFFQDVDTIFPHLASDERTDREAMLGELRDTLEKNLDLLDTKYREVLVLYFFEELSYQDIADVLQIPVSTVGVRLKRAKDALRTVYRVNNPV